MDFFSTFQWCGQQENVYYRVSITEALSFSLQFQEDSVHFSCLKKIIVDI